VGRTLPGAVLLGVISAVPITLGANFLLNGQVVPHEESLFAAIIYPILFGGSMGFFFWRNFVRSRKR
jgi:hypothetical protein